MLMTLLSLLHIPLEVGAGSTVTPILEMKLLRLKEAPCCLPAMSLGEGGSAEIGAWGLLDLKPTFLATVRPDEVAETCPAPVLWKLSSKGGQSPGRQGWSFSLKTEDYAAQTPFSKVTVHSSV